MATSEPKLPYCGKCAEGAVSHECAGALSRIGVIKMHWECWADCNLNCPFCYRTRDAPLATQPALCLIAAAKTAGTRSLVFGGGDPSLRADIHQLVTFAKTVGLEVELQTNAHAVSPLFRNALDNVDIIGLSLDGGDPNTHDEFRRKKGNFGRVLSLLESLNHRGATVIVRTVIADQDASSLAALGKLLSAMECVRRWSLLEFSAVGDGWRNRSKYEITRAEFEASAAVAREAFQSDERLDVYRLEEKVGTYALVTPGGRLYGTGGAIGSDGFYPTVGSMIDNHLTELAFRLPFDCSRHEQRYSPSRTM